MSTISYTKEITVAKTYDIIVCGAGPAGICAAVAAARQGAKVALVDINGEALDKQVAEIASYNPNVMGICIDIRD